MNFYNSLYTLEIEYINKQLSTYYSSLIKSGKISPQGLIINDDDNYDPDFIHEIERMTKKTCVLKRLLEINPYIDQKVLSRTTSNSCKSNQNLRFQVKPRSINSQGTSPFYRHSKPTITSPNPNMKKSSSSSSSRNKSSMTQSKSTIFNSSTKFYRKK